jgi:hypothetical protein
VRRFTAPVPSSSTARRGGTGAAPLEFADHIGTPLTEGLMTVHNALVGAGLRDRIPRRARALDVGDKDARVRRLQEATDLDRFTI